MENYIVRTENNWAESTVELLRRWERDCQYRKKAHYKAANSFGWKNKLFSIPVIIISTVIGSLSFIHPSFTDTSPSDCTPSRMLQMDPPSCNCVFYMNGASDIDINLCWKSGGQCFPPNSGDGLCPGDMLACTTLSSPTASPSLNPSPFPSAPPISECFWENYNSDNIIPEASYCDNKIVEYQSTFYKSTLSEVDKLVCDRDVNFVDSTAYHQFPMVDGITTQSEAEAWCVEHDEGYGIFYQQWVDGQIICMVLIESPNNMVVHGAHTFGGVCLSDDILNNPTQTYINNCGGEDQIAVDMYDGNCALVADCVTACPGIIGGYHLQTQGFFDCACCYNYWEGCSWGECSGESSAPPPTPTISSVTPISEPTNAPTNIPTNAPTNVPTNAPTNVPTYAPTYAPTNVPTYAPTNVPTNAPTNVPTNAPTNVPTYAPIAETINMNYASYIIGAFNMIIAILSALHAFLKYDALEDRHHQYSRHFGNLKLDIETLLCKSESHRGDSIATMENFKTKYSVLMNNAPDLPSRLEQNCMDIACMGATTKRVEIELT